MVISGAYPSSIDPSRGIFVHQRVRALAELPGIDVHVIAPTPWAPPVRAVKKWHDFSRMPDSEVLDGITIDRPRYPLPPKVGGYFHPQLMAPALLKSARRLQENYCFDLIDAHFVYAAGVAATKVAKTLGVPVCLTGRGEDMLRFPSLPFKGKRIRWALQNADAFVGVSHQIAEAMRTHGAPPERVATIPNGVDVEQFRPKPTEQCRQFLGLPADCQILVTVGDLTELKGFHLIIEALPEILKTHPNAMYVCIGGPGRHGRDYTHEIQSRIDRLGVADRVLIAGPQSHDALVDWYNAADLYVLASAREGSPNALLEALACGLPAVATRVGGAPDELEPTGFGYVMHERTPEAAAKSICEALTKQWDRKTIRQAMESRSWKSTAEAVHKHLLPLLL